MAPTVAVAVYLAAPLGAMAQEQVWDVSGRCWRNAGQGACGQGWDVGRRALTPRALTPRAPAPAVGAAGDVRPLSLPVPPTAPGEAPSPEQIEAQIEALRRVAPLVERLGLLPAGDADAAASAAETAKD